MREVVVADLIFWAEGGGRQDIWPVQGVSRARRATVEPQLKIGLGRGLSLCCLRQPSLEFISFIYIAQTHRITRCYELRYHFIPSLI